jgi:uncharacterized membrane protein YhaH (DUF805 family)
MLMVLSLAVGHLLAFLVLIIPVIIGVIFCSVALSVKRLHDRIRSGWWLLLYYGTGVLEAAVDRTGLAETPEQWSGLGIAMGLVSLVISVWFLMELGFLRGTQGPNPFGPDPLVATQADAKI